MKSYENQKLIVSSWFVLTNIGACLADCTLNGQFWACHPSNAEKLELLKTGICKFQLLVGPKGEPVKLTDETIILENNFELIAIHLCGEGYAGPLGKNFSCYLDVSNIETST